MVTNQGYWLLMVNIELSDRLKLIKYPIKICDAPNPAPEGVSSEGVTLRDGTL